MTCRLSHLTLGRCPKKACEEETRNMFKRTILALFGRRPVDDQVSRWRRRMPTLLDALRGTR